MPNKQSSLAGHVLRSCRLKQPIECTRTSPQRAPHRRAARRQSWSRQGTASWILHYQARLDRPRISLTCRPDAWTGRQRSTRRTQGRRERHWIEQTKPPEASTRRAATSLQSRDLALRSRRIGRSFRVRASGWRSRKASGPWDTAPIESRLHSTSVLREPSTGSESAHPLHTLGAVDQINHRSRGPRDRPFLAICAPL